MITKQYLSLEEQIESFNGFNVNITQLSSGPFFGTERSILLPHMVISRKSTNQSILFTVNPSESDITVFSLPLNKHWQKINGKLYDYDLAIISESQNSMVLLHPKDVARIDFHLVKSQIDDYTKLHCISDEPVQRGKVTFNVNSYTLLGAQAQSICNQGIQILMNAEHWNYQACLDAQDSLMLQISRFLHRHQLNFKSTSKGRRRTIVMKALELIHDNPEKNYTIKELCENCFCSPRTLENAFNDFLSIPPKQYLIKRRLNVIRELLSNQRTETISELLNTFGVTNFGRFSNDYFRLFGELPSVTKKG